MIVEAEARLKKTQKLQRFLKAILVVVLVYTTALAFAYLGWSGHKNDLSPIATGMIVVGVISFLAVLMMIVLFASGFGSAVENDVETDTE